MLFNSFEFLLLFLPATLLAWTLLAKTGGSQTQLQLLLFIASCIFIATSGALSLILLLSSLAYNYGLLRILSRTQSRRGRGCILAVSVVLNLGLIGVFKYADFLGRSTGFLSGHAMESFNIELPLAISFYTFQLIALTVDSWRYGWACPPLGKFAVFVTFFPQLIAGPIVRYDEIREDLDNLMPPRAANMALGTALLLVGLFKKAVLADSLAAPANLFFDGVEAGVTPAVLESWGGVLAYTFQIYFDFSGYSDMAIGLATMFGIRLPANFYSPYKATSIIEFWRRWHMTLSRFLRDYLYIPLGGNRSGSVSRWWNVMVTMLLGGLWHGAAWNFVAWGGMHGVLIAGNHLVRRLGVSVPYYAGWALTFFVVTLSWVVFRTSELGAAGRIYAGLAGANGIVLPERLESLLGPITAQFPFITFASSELFRLPSVFLILAAAVVAFAFPNSEQLFRERSSEAFLLGRYALALGSLGAIGLFGINQATEFVYFRF